MGKAKKEQKTLFDFERSDVPIEEQPYSIPENWVWTRLSRILTASGEKTEDFSDTSLKYVGLEHLQKDKGIIGYGSSCDIKSAKNVFHKGQLLYGKLRPYLNKHDVAEFSGVCSTDILVFDSAKYITKHYINNYFNTRYFISYTNENSKGINLPRVSETIVLNVICPLPPLAEQARIVSLIESLFSRLDEARVKAQEVIDGFELWKSAILHKAFTGRLVEQRPEEGTGEELFREIQAEKQLLVKEGKIKKEKPLPEIKEDEIPFEIPEGWKWVRMSEALDVRDGTHDTPQYSEIGIPLVTSKNLVKGCIDFGTTKNISQKDADMINARSFVDDGDVLYAMIGSIGNPVLVKKDREFCIKNMALFKPLCKDLFLMKYLFFFLEKQQEDMKKRASGGLQPFVSLKFLRSYLCPLAPTNEQKRIVATIESLLSRMDKAVDKAKAVVEQIDAIKKSILEKAFRGELGTNDTTEESALALLKSAE